LADAPIPRAPAFDPVAAAALQTFAAAAPVPPPSGAAPSDPPNAQALHNVVLKVATDHPDLVAGPGWERLADYVGHYA
jgi:hypothetical protein